MRLLVELQSEIFATRQKATMEIEQIGDQAGPTLREALKRTPSLEVRQRVENLLTRLAAPAEEQLRALRAVEVLEHVGDEPARILLASLTKGTPHSRPTREVQQSRERLDWASKTR